MTEGRQDLAAVIAEMHEYGKYYYNGYVEKWADRLALLLAEAPRVNVCQCHHSREQHGAGESPRCLVDGCPCTYFVLVVPAALLETRGVPQEEHEKKEHEKNEARGRTPADS